MKITSKIAWAYFWKQREVQAVQLISWISLIAMMIAAAAMITLFSVYNGLEDTVKKMYHTFYADLEITPAKGKFFELSEEQLTQIELLSQDYSLHQVAEDLVLMNFDQNQQAVKLRGVTEEWLNSHGIGDYLFSGEATWHQEYPFPVLMGLGVATDLQVDVFTFLNQPSLFYLDASRPLHSMSALDLPEYQVQMVGTFHIQEEFDQQYVLAPLGIVQDVLGTDALSALQINDIGNSSRIKKLKSELIALLGDDFEVKDRYQQNQTLYWIMQSEKWAIYAILAFVMIIASFNMIGAISMLILEKKHEVFILKSMGMLPKQLFWSFLKLGLLITGLGGLIGLIIGTLLCLGQIYFGWISFPDGFVVQAFPVKFYIWDFVVVLASTLLIGGVASLMPSMRVNNMKGEK